MMPPSERIDLAKGLVVFTTVVSRANTTSWKRGSCITGSVCVVFCRLGLGMSSFFQGRERGTMRDKHDRKAYSHLKLIYSLVIEQHLLKC